MPLDVMFKRFFFIFVAISTLAGRHSAALAQASDHAKTDSSKVTPESKPLWKARVLQADSGAATSAKRADSHAIDPVVLNAYLKDAERKVKRNWFPPKCSTKVVSVSFRINAQGDVSHIRIVKSSETAIADQAALKAVENAAPYRKLPEGARSYEDFAFTFDYNVFKPGDKPMLTLTNSQPKRP